MDTIILNSGFGSRLKEHCSQVPKGLVPLGDGETILGRQLRLLRELGHTSFVITTGYLDGSIQEYCAQEFPTLAPRYFYNPRFASTNYITSLELLRESVSGDVLLLHGDLVFERSVIRDVSRSSRTTVVVDSTLPLPDKDFKARIRDGKVRQIGVDLKGSDCQACQALYKLTRQDWKLWQDAIHAFCLDGVEGVYAENALNTVTGEMDLWPLDVRGRLCMEIDTEEDLQLGRERVAADPTRAPGYRPSEPHERSPW